MLYVNRFALSLLLALCVCCTGKVPAVDDGPEVPADPPAVEFESAAEAVANMGPGWNLGNTLDTHSGSIDNMWIEAWTSRTPRDYETGWGQPQTTRALIHMFKEAGFGAIRVPVTWYPHMGRIVLYDDNKWDKSSWTGTDVDPVWMARVKEVVDYVIDEGMYCILNVHHDTGADDTAWLVADRYVTTERRFCALWSQIADAFKDYGDHLLFESYNEMLDSYDSWCFASYASPSRYDAAAAAAAYDGINNYARSFVQTVRATGGNNTVRNLVVNTYGACSGDGTWNQHLKEPLSFMQIPEKPGHIAIQVHSYWESEKFSESQKKEIDQLFVNLDTHIVKRLGVPVIIGEWGGGAHEDTNQNYYFANYFSTKAREAGVAAFYWMSLSDKADREVPKWTMPKTKNAIISAFL